MNEKENNYTVYMHTSPSKKRYVGITKQYPLEKRWRHGKGYKYNEYFSRAIKKYGWENFKHEVLFDNLTQKEAEEKEIELIDYYKSNLYEYGYNIQNGGNSNGKFSEETILKIAKAATNPSEETRRKMSVAQKARLTNPEDNPMYGKTHTAEARKKISEARKGKRLSNETRERMSESRKKRAVCQYTKENEFVKLYVSITEANKQTGINYSNICTCCSGNGRQKTAGGYIWRYADGE